MESIFIIIIKFIQLDSSKKYKALFTFTALPINGNKNNVVNIIVFVINM